MFRWPRPPATDQRGVARDAAPDIGAYELVREEPPAAANKISLVEVAAPYGKVAIELVADLPASKVNLIEAVLKYDASAFDADAGSLVTSATINRVVVDAEKGLIQVVIGVKNEETIAEGEPLRLAGVVLTPKNGEQPPAAHVSIASQAAYSLGSAVDCTPDPAAVYARFTYISPLDVNKDGTVNAADLSLALYYFGAESTDSNWNDASAADVNRDGVVDITDITSIVDAIYA